ncbi:MAG: hypothetical protein U1F71_08390 [Verrucomicrobiaceae bacterium]
MKIISSCLALATLLTRLLHAEIDLPLETAWPGKQFVPPGVRLSLKLPSAVVIGYEIPAALVVKNAGTESFEFSVGGDYRSTGYPQRMKVRVCDAAGNLLPELLREAYGFDGGGLGGGSKLTSGESREVEFPLDCYVQFTKPGDYTIYVGHDLGWKLDPAYPHPMAQASLKVTMPTAAEAAAHVDAVFASQPTPKPRDESDALQQQLKLEKSLCVLRHPIYLPVLTRHAQAGSTAAVKGIGHIATPEATDVLLALLDHTNAKVVETSAQQIHRRLPKLDAADKPELPYYWRSQYQIEPLLPGSWQPRFETPLLHTALKLLEHESEDVVQLAGQVLKSRGTAVHAPELLAVLQKSLDAPHESQSGPDAKTLGLPVPQRSLIEALDSLRARGWRLESGTGGTAHLVAWFRQLADTTVPKPKDDAWKSSMLPCVENGPKALKIAALEAIPQPFSGEAVRTVKKAFEDKDWGVVRVACEVAGKSKRPEFVRPLVQLVETAHENFLNHAARNAAFNCGARMELWEALASTLVVGGLMSDALHELVVCTIELPYSGSAGGNGCSREQSFLIRDAWWAFLQKHRKAFAEGRKIAPPDAATTAALTGAIFDAEHPAVEFKLKDGTRWPPIPPRK